MNKMHKKCGLFLLLVFIATLGLQLHAQQVVMNSKGEKIVIFPDGSWRYFEAADSILVKQNMRHDESLKSPTEIDRKEESPLDPTLNNASSKRVAIEFANQLRDESARARAVLVNATNDKFNIEAKLNQALESPDLIDVDVRARLEEEYQQATDEVKNAKAYHKQISKLAEKALSIPDMDEGKRENALSKLTAKHSAFVSSSEWKPAGFVQRESVSIIADRSVPSQIVQKQNEKQKAKKEKEAKKTSVSADRWDPPAQDIYRRKPYTCELQIDDIDDVTQQRRIVVEPQRIFAHTDQELRPYFRDENLLKCDGFVSSVEGFKYLTLNFTIASPNAKRNFGILQEGAMLRIKLIDGSFLNFYNIRADRGRIDSYTGNTIYSGNYALGKSAEQALLKSEIDKMRVVWSTGYEDYDIHKVDFFIDQINCINNQ